MAAPRGPLVSCPPTATCPLHSPTPPSPTISCCSFISGGEFCSIFAQHPSCSFSGWKDPEIPSNLCLTSSCDQHLDGAHLANSKFSLTCFKFSDESEVTPRHRLRWGTIPLTQMGRIPITPSSRYYLHQAPQSFSVKCGFLWSEQLLCNLQAFLDKSTLSGRQWRREGWRCW